MNRTLVITESHSVKCFEVEQIDILRFLEKCRMLRQLGGYGEIRIVMRDGFLVEWHSTQREHCNPS